MRNVFCQSLVDSSQCQEFVFLTGDLGYIALVYEKDYKTAITYFTDAIRVNDQYAEAFYNRGMAFELSGDEASAQKDFHSAVRIVPTFKLALKKIK